ncbi:MAG TPA: gluconate 2-dehydrogenase subunit 3 family protein, partial [Gemmatimonadales bacterium]|nr:gluconate 2-dehydrogenase subunit 3 family protein [Gemmatimonadales bacterium]
LLTGLDAEVAALRRDNARPEHHFFYQFKSLTLYGYYTSEIGAAETHYQTIPGSYDACVELS